MRTINKDSQSAITPQMALSLLQEGNERFIKNLKFNRNLLQQVNETRDGQWPFAVILSCIDSRTSAELIFDQGLGDIFSIRIAGNIINEDILGSLEFATKVANSKLIVVLGHSQCGAIKGACDNVQMGNLSGLLAKIQPAIKEETSVKTNRNSENSEFVEKVAAINVMKATESISTKSELLRNMITNGQVGIIGAMYEVSTGKVQFYNQEKLK
ncbi:MAG: carbonic anhydrase [Bacteroidetes bacterium]|nr:MAG: carbonic anhydrase [Bacteroidota bacterium]